MAKRSDYTEQVVARITIQQRTFLDDLAALHGVKASEIVRAIIEQGRAQYVADKAIATIDEVLGPIEEAGAHANH